MVVIYAINAHPIDREEEKTGEKDVAIPKPRQDPVHHIVAKADPRAAEARKILRDVGIEPVTIQEILWFYLTVIMLHCIPLHITVMLLKD